MKLFSSVKSLDVVHHPVIPFLLACGGVVADYLSTRIGLRMGFVEAHLHYHPLYGLTFFLSLIAVLTILLPRKQRFRLVTLGVAFLSYLGIINNTLVILGWFPGILT
jgi:hypothetical protein